MKKFIYKGPAPCYFAYIAKEGVVEAALFYNEAYELPAKDDFVKSLIAQGFLIDFKNSKNDK